MHIASSSSLPSRVTPALVVFGAHAVLIYAVAMSLGFLEVPQIPVVSKARIFEEPRKPETQEVIPHDPVIDPSRRQIPEIPIPDTVFPENVPESPITVVAVPEPANPVPIQPTAAPDVTLAVTRRVDPLYPPISRRLGEAGSVTLRVLVDERGAPADVQIAQSSGYTRLDDAAVQAVRRWSFRAATRDAHATSAWTRVKVTFALSQ